MLAPMESPSLPSRKVVVELPELLILILGHLDTYDLTRAIRVNKFWFHWGITLLWANATPVWALAAVEDRRRRQEYASAICSLYFKGPKCDPYVRFDNLTFDRLSLVSLDEYNPEYPDRFCLHQYLQPSLEEFLFYKGTLEEHTLDFMASNCPRLRRLYINRLSSKLSLSSFQAFVARCSSLAAVTLKYSHIFTDELFCYLAARRGLESIEWGEMIGTDVLNQIRAQVSVPFANIQHLSSTITITAVPVLVPLVPNITSLELHVKPLDDSFDADISAAAITSLARLTKLEKLDVTFGSGYSDILNFTDTELDQLVRRLPDLKEIALDMPCELSPSALNVLSKHCKMLEQCRMRSLMDLGMLELDSRQDILFPHLKEFEIGAIQAPNEEYSGPLNDPDEATALIQKHFPKLEWLGTSGLGDPIDWSYGEAIIDILTPILELRSTPD
ncbi:hypothetical protein GGS23DRAFT_596078 [Durotheca rogersii]|uniref:uncharacterized protein n=1 Tax=Durotheca rogersii TaxID=419775 RepID=UPI00221E99A4|nr:uncharacterized protein GGS23DRAFT_596078 [Durotheca rogersii]KAI5864445.1 hypothetical protein GGS23DRAFT_596078 [Durotheca rogersii]